MIQHLLDVLKNAPPLPFYLLVAAAAAIQNVFPIPAADIVVLFGAFITAAAHQTSLGVFFAAWGANVLLAIGIYALAVRHRLDFGDSRFGKWLLRGKDLRTLEAQRRWDLSGVFVSSFLPVRPLLPVLGGLARVPLWRVALPIGAASGVWYAVVVFVGTKGGKNFQTVVRTFDEYNEIFLLVVAVITVAWLAWWLLHRKRRSAASGIE